MNTNRRGSADRAPQRVRVREAEDTRHEPPQPLSPWRGEALLGPAWFAMSEARYRQALDVLLESCWLIDWSWRLAYLNEAAARQLGAERDALVGTSILDAVPALQDSELLERLRRAMEQAEPAHFEAELRLGHGPSGWYELALHPVPEGLFVLLADATRRAEAERQLRGIARLYAVLAHMNAAIQLVRDEREFFEACVRIAVDDGGFRLAWVGLVDQIAQTVRPVAAAGEAAEYADGLVIGLSGDLGSGPTGRTATSGGIVTCDDIANDPRMVPWRERALAYGLASSAGIPLLLDGRTHAVLTVYAGAPGSFGDHQMQVLRELQRDVSFGLATIRERTRLAERDAELQEAQRVASIGSWSWDAAADEVTWSDEFYRIAGREIGTPAPNYYKDHPGLYTAESWERLQPLVARAMTTGEPYALDLELVRPDGTTRWIAAQGEAVQGPDGSVRGLRGVVHDITERHVAQESMRTSEALMRGSLDAMRDPLVVCTPVQVDDGAPGMRVEFVNTAAERSMGVPAEQLTGGILPEAAVEIGGAFISDHLRRVIETGRPLSLQSAPFRVANGRRGYVSLQVVPFGQRLLVTWRDVTEQEAVARERGELAAIVEGSADAIVIADGGWRITYANAAALAAARPTDDGVIGRDVREALGLLVSDDLIPDVLTAVTAGRSWLGEIDEHRAEGDVRHLEVTVTPTLDADGRLQRSVIVLRDVTALREADAELSMQERIRWALDESLRRVSPTIPLEDAAQAICEELMTLPYIDMAAVDGFLDPDIVQVMGLAAPEGYPISVGDALPPERAAFVREHVTAGSWAQQQTLDPGDGGFSARLLELGIKALAFGPIRHGDHVDGEIVVGTSHDEFAQLLTERMPALVTFSAAASGLLAERLHATRETKRARDRIAAVIAERAFSPVFQPIVDLETAEIMGFEALTRFDSGTRPDVVLAEAWSVGLGPELELAMIRATMEAAPVLPPGRWLDLNVSPPILADPERLRELLWNAARPMVIEVTEHQVIEDYGVVRDGVRVLGRDFRLAVDDAGAGVANFGHIIELRPDFVKLDMSLVRRINANLGRQAMVVGMRHFSRTAGCRLVAEGVETEDEAATLRGLGVDFGQGYVFGHPQPATAWVDSEIAVPTWSEAPDARPAARRPRSGGRRRA